MKALSVQQPWAWLLANGHKDIENRTWPTKVRGWVLIHAGKTVDVVACNRMADRRDWPPMPSPFDATRGAIVGAMRIDNCVSESPSRWFSGPYGFTIGRAVAFARPMECRGMLGFFPVDLNSPNMVDLVDQLPLIALEGAA